MLQLGCFTFILESIHAKMPHCWKSHVTAQITTHQVPYMCAFSEHVCLGKKKCVSGFVLKIHLGSVGWLFYFFLLK